MCFPNPYFVFSTPSNPLVDGILTCFMIFLFDLNTFTEHFFVSPRKFLTNQFVWPFVRTTNLLLLFLFLNLQGVVVV